MAKPVMQDKVWAGSEASLAMHLQQLEAAEVRMGSGWNPDEDQEDEIPYLLSIKDGIGIVAIRGPLTNQDREYFRYFGISSYTAIREALVYAAESSDVTQILLDIDSGGGAVNGVSDVGALIRTIDTKVKPVTAFTDGTMASAAYWLGCSARKVYASKVATVGSIGVIATHMEYSKQLKEEGVGVTVMRSGQYKALINSVEPLTETARSQFQEMLDAAYKVFAQHVATMRNVSYDEADKRMGQGREFFGEHAVSAGLVDGIESFDSLFSKLSNVTIDNRTHVPENVSQFRTMSSSQEVSMARQALTDQTIAALAEAGISVPVEPDTAKPVVDTPAATEPSAATAPATDAATDAAAESTAEPVANATDTSIVAFLQSQVAERDTNLISARVALAAATEKLTSLEAVVGDLVAIAAKSASNMQVALGGTALDMSAMSPLAVLAEHKRISTQFSSKFKVGGVAAVDAASVDQKEPVLDPLHMARIAATRVK